MRYSLLENTMRVLSLSRKGSFITKAERVLKLDHRTVTKAIGILSKNELVNVWIEIKGLTPNKKTFTISPKGREVLVIWIDLCKRLGEDYSAYLC